MRQLAAAITFFFFSTGLVWADYYDGLRAFDQENYASAAQFWTTAAKQGDANSLYRLGQLHENGTGVLQDFVKAHALYNIASANGSKAASQSRNRLAKQMTKQEQAEARALAKAWPSWLESSTNSAALPATKQGVERFDGLWKWEAVGGSSMCIVVFGPPTEIRNGKYRAGVTHGSDGGLTSVSGTIDEDGKVSGYGSGMYVAVYVKGRIDGDKAEGIADVGGEASCTVEWAATRIKK